MGYILYKIHIIYVINNNLKHTSSSNLAKSKSELLKYTLSMFDMISALHFSGGFSLFTVFNISEPLFLLELSQKSCDPINGTFTAV